MTTSWAYIFGGGSLLFTSLLGCGSSVGGGAGNAGGGGQGATGGQPEATVSSKQGTTGGVGSGAKGKPGDTNVGAQGTTGTGAAAIPAGKPPKLSYPGKGFIVHEWGTNTVVVGSDGSLQRGLQHEEEDLPDFVFDRLKAGALPGAHSVEVKMETPITYFYAETARKVIVTVNFPQGVFTQWYPVALRFLPPVLAPNALPGLGALRDPIFDDTIPYKSPVCAAKYSKPKNGLLSWGEIDVLDRGAAIAPPDAPLAQYTWSFARQVDSNPVRSRWVGGPKFSQEEKFLFYRGLGSFELPVKVTAKGSFNISLVNGYKEAVPRVIVLNVGADKGAFAVKAQGIAPGATLDAIIPSLSGAPAKADYAQALGDAVTEALDATGLYHDEAEAMVNTWKRQWFGTPGVRLLYLIPQSWTDASIPLTISPPPDAMVRVMMIRVEVITPELEQADVLAAKKLSSSATVKEGEAYFVALGRFAEPRLRRALTLLGQPSYGDALLASLASIDTRSALGE